MHYYEDDKYYKLWNEEHPQFANYIDRINNFAQSDGIMEDDVDEMETDFEDGNYHKLFDKLKSLKYEVEDLYHTIDNAYDYMKKMMKNQKKVVYVFEKSKGDDTDFTFTITKDDEVIHTIEFKKDKKYVSEIPHFVEFNNYNRKLFYKILGHLGQRNKIQGFFYEKV